MAELGPVPGLVDHLFRHAAGGLVARLTRVFGPARLELAEDVVQEALVAALKRWPFQGVPDDPEAWLARVARNRALDRLRRDATLRDKEADLVDWNPVRHAPAADEGLDELADDRLRLVFTCCHPALAPEARVALTLKTVCGFGVGEIARAFLAERAAIAQRLVRAKRRLREAEVAFEVPGAAELPRRLDSVLDVLYLLFNEGYAASGGEELVRADLLDEALRLTGLVLEHEATRSPVVHALFALMLLQGARSAARTDPRGELLLLADQDRSLWDRSRIALGFRALEAAGTGDVLSRYHLEAGIAACHASSPDFESTDWTRIAGYYDQLALTAPSPVVALNRAVALAMRDGPAAGLAELERLDGDARLARYYLLEATRGELLLRSGDPAAARAAFERALERDCSGPEKRFLRRRLAASG